MAEGQVRPEANAAEYQRQEALKRRAAGETLAEIAKSNGVDISTISQLAPGFRAPFDAAASMKRGQRVKPT
jgi:transcriptional regulator with XRE-family HTH domain